jgi:hypothetical protein
MTYREAKMRAAEVGADRVVRHYCDKCDGRGVYFDYEWDHPAVHADVSCDCKNKLLKFPKPCKPGKCERDGDDIGWESLGLYCARVYRCKNCGHRFYYEGTGV